ncbi:MAG: hypothetical protein Pg6A_01700 [Termitinemataceae bacterium]|nr:MAG: hypothetical protein Pg6A_01700 [Termitinemataceae bacterium]
MAECLAPQKLDISAIRFIDVKEQADCDYITNILKDIQQKPMVRTSPNFFVGGFND